jgi:hypothetical protein
MLVSRYASFADNAVVTVYFKEASLNKMGCCSSEDSNGPRLYTFNLKMTDDANETDDAGLNNQISDFWVLGLLMLGVEWRKMVASVDSIDWYDEEDHVVGEQKTQRLHYLPIELVLYFLFHCTPPIYHRRSPVQ